MQISNACTYWESNGIPRLCIYFDHPAGKLKSTTITERIFGLYVINFDLALYNMIYYAGKKILTIKLIP